MAQALEADTVAGYFTRNSRAGNRAVWLEQLRAAARANPDARFYCLAGHFQAAALVLSFPDQAVSAVHAAVRRPARPRQRAAGAARPSPAQLGRRPPLI
jgi:hypothetical protein